MIIALSQSVVFATDFSCNFENGATDANKWTIVKVVQGGTWAITPATTGNVFHFDRAGGFGENLISAKNVTMTDGIVSADLIMHDAIGGSATGILVRYVDVDNYYMYRLNWSEGKVQLYRKIGGTFTKLNEFDLGASPDFDRVYNLKIKVEGQKFTCYLDNEEKFTTTDDNASLTSGTIGFRVYDQSVSIDNVLITAVGPSSVTSVEDTQTTLFYNRSNQKIELRSENEIYEIQIYNTSGSLLQKVPANDFEKTIPVSDWSNGVYIVRVNTTNGRIVKKIVKL